MCKQNYGRNIFEEKQVLKMTLQNTNLNYELYLDDCLEVMKKFEDESIDMVMTSPPYDNLRDYNGNNAQWNFEKFTQIAKELYRVLKNGGVIVWIVADQTIKCSETGSSFRQALKFMDIGFKLYDTMIWNKKASGSIGSMLRYENVFEYMFVFSKGKPKTANIICDKKNKRFGENQYGSIRQSDGSIKKTTGYGKKQIQQFGRRHNIWEITPCKGKDRSEHPAPFPVQLANDHIITWSNENDIILDVFMGSGSTGIACLNTNRKFIGIELDEKYFNIAKERIENHIKK